MSVEAGDERWMRRALALAEEAGVPLCGYDGKTGQTYFKVVLASDDPHDQGKIMEVMQSSQQQRPRLRRLGDRLGAYYTPLAIALGVAAWAISACASDPRAADPLQLRIPRALTLIPTDPYHVFSTSKEEKCWAVLVSPSSCSSS